MKRVVKVVPEAVTNVAQPRLLAPTVYELPASVIVVKVSEVAPVVLISTSPRGMPPIPLKVSEPTTAWKPLPLYPSRLTAYCPIRIDSFPDSQTETVSLPIVMLIEEELAVADFESVTCKVTDADPVPPTGTPEITPVLVFRRQAGRQRAGETLHV